MQTNAVPYDNDLVRWGLHLLDGGGSFFPETGFNNSNYATERRDSRSMELSPGVVTFDNDETIAHVLQEELSNLAAAESSSEAIDSNSKSTVLNQDWPNNSGYDNSYGTTDFSEGDTGREGEEHGKAAETYQDDDLTTEFHSLAVEDEDTMYPIKRSLGTKGKGKSSNSDYDKYQTGDDEENLHLALALSEDEQRFDAEVAKRLTKLDSIRHVPRTNLDIPTLDAAALDHARLMERLVLYGLNEQKIQGDGNCQFRALSDQLYRTPEHHKFVRKTIVSQLKNEPDIYSGYVPMGYSEYLKKMAKSGEWGDHVTLQAAADSYGVKIWLITSFKETAFIEIVPTRILSNRVIYLSFWAEVHYNSIYPEGEDLQSGEEW